MITAINAVFVFGPVMFAFSYSTRWEIVLFCGLVLQRVFLGFVQYQKVIIDVV